MSEIKQRTVYLLKRTDKPDDGTDIYVGSTSQALKKRLWSHKHYTKIVNSKLYVRMKEVGINNWRIIPLLTYLCDQKTILEFEKSWVELLNPDLNTYSPLDTTKKWRNNSLKELKKTIIVIA